jgi:hypothetical protein
VLIFTESLIHASNDWLLPNPRVSVFNCYNSVWAQVRGLRHPLLSVVQSLLVWCGVVWCVSVFLTAATPAGRSGTASPCHTSRSWRCRRSAAPSSAGSGRYKLYVMNPRSLCMGKRHAKLMAGSGRSAALRRTRATGSTPSRTASELTAAKIIGNFERESMIDQSYPTSRGYLIGGDIHAPGIEPGTWTKPRTSFFK